MKALWCPKQGKQLESPNTLFDGAQEFSHTTSGAGGSLQSPSEVDSGSQGRGHNTISREQQTPRAPYYHAYHASHSMSWPA